MFQRMIDDFKDFARRLSMRSTSLIAAMALALFITLAFLCAAAFVYVLQTYGLIQACLAGAAIFFVVTLVVAAGYMARRKRVKTRVAGEYEIRAALRAGGSDAGGNRHPAGPRDRHQAAASDPGDRRFGARNPGKSRQFHRRRRNCRKPEFDQI